MRLDPSTASRLAKICGLLGSDQDGERSAAAWQATKLLRAHGLTWGDVFAPPAAIHAPYSPPPSAPASPHVLRARRALRFPERLTAWETAFLSSLCQRRKLTPRQQEILATIERKIPPGGDV